MSDGTLFNYVKIVLTVSARVRFNTTDLYNGCTLNWRNSRNLLKSLWEIYSLQIYHFLQWLIDPLNFLGFFLCKPLIHHWFSRQTAGEMCLPFYFRSIACLQPCCLSKTLSLTNLQNGSWMQLCCTITTTSESTESNWQFPTLFWSPSSWEFWSICLALGEIQSSLMTASWNLCKVSV